MYLKDEFIASIVSQPEWEESNAVTETTHLEREEQNYLWSKVILKLSWQM